MHKVEKVRKDGLLETFDVVRVCTQTGKLMSDEVVQLSTANTKVEGNELDSEVSGYCVFCGTKFPGCVGVKNTNTKIYSRKGISGVQEWWSRV